MSKVTQVTSLSQVHGWHCDLPLSLWHLAQCLHTLEAEGTVIEKMCA